MFTFRPVLKWLRGGARRARRSVEPGRFRPSLESLECRLTPSGNVTTSLVDGNLTITDNAETSSLTLSQPAAGEITITPDAGTTINGKAGPVTISRVTGGLNVNLTTGNDTLTFDLSQHSFSIGKVSITGTTGDKNVLTNAAGTTNFLNVHGSFTESFGSGTEFIQLHQFNVTGNVTFDHANGDEFLFLGVDDANLGKLFNSVTGSLTVANVTSTGATGSGSDVAALEETNVLGNITSHMGTGDQVGTASWTSVGSLSSNSITVGGNVNIIAKSGFLAFGDFAQDGEEVVNAHIAGDVTLDLGSGAANTALFGNGASASSTSARNVTILGSGPHDAVTIGPSGVHNNLAVTLTGEGGNSITVDDVSVTGTTALMAAGGGNSIAIDNQVPGSTFAGSVSILMGGTSNLLEINSHSQGAPGTTTFGSSVSANLGGGNDTLVLAEAGSVRFKAASTFDGGPGTNHVFVSHQNIKGTQPTLVNFS
jgi:hypothetical protein